MKSVVTRFAPSPTGMLHIGGRGPVCDCGQSPWEQEHSAVRCAIRGLSAKPWRDKPTASAQAQDAAGRHTS